MRHLVIAAAHSGAPWWGTLPSWLTVIGLLAVGIVLYRGAAGPALGYLQEANRVLERKVQELIQQHRADVEELASLRATTSLEPIVAALSGEFAAHERRAVERHVELLRAFNEHAQRNAERHEQLLRFGDAIIKRIGGDYQRPDAPPVERSEPGDV